MEDKQIADYFVVAGLTENSMPLEDFSFDGSPLKSTYDQAPITDITVIIRSLGEAVPPGFTCIEHTPSGFPADLNYGSLRSPEVFLCYRRGRDRPPLVDIGVLYQGKERVMSDSEVVLSTPYGRPANVNNSINQHTYLTYRRAPESAPCNDLVVSDICIVITSKNEQPPHAYNMIKKNLNKGMLGSDVYLCYKKSMNKPRYIAYRPGIQARYPQEDIINFPLPDSVPLFCLPMGATLEWWPSQALTPKPVFSTFVLTVSDAAEKVYGSAVSFYERYPEEKMTKEQRAWLDMEDPVEDPNAPKDYTVNTIKSICILSHWPFFDTFEKFLRFLHKMAHSGPHVVPIERYISHFIYDVPFPSAQRPRILIQLSAIDRIALAQPEDLPLPRRGASFRQLLLNLGPDGCLSLLLLALTEQKVLLHSLRPDVLTATAEALVASIFPFKWQCPYIPLCPLGLSDVLNAPLPFLIGVDSRFFDMYDPPADVSCVDLDTNTISLCEEKKNLLSVKLLPKKPTRNLRNTLHMLYEKIYMTHWSDKSKRDASDGDVALDRDFKIKKKELLLELDIQEAFLKFMASILRGYRSFLLPITKAPTIGATDPNSLFDLQGFLRSRDKTYVKFYSMLMKTQMFIRFIEERSFVSDMDSSLAFFDECSDKTDLDDSDVKLLELDESHQSERTVFVMPPEPTGLPPNATYTYDHFGDLNLDLMERSTDNSESLRPPGSGMKPRSNSATAGGFLGPSPGSPLARRTKHEIKNSQRVAKKYAETPMLWARCLLNTCFSIWFIHLPSHVLSTPSKAAYSNLIGAFELLVKMQKLRLHPADEVCYRVMMQLCGAHSQPVLAVKVLFEMKRHGVQPNAITYGFYNKAVLEAHWSSDMVNHSQLLWNKLKNVVTAAGLFRQAGRIAAQRRISQYSSADDVDLPSGSASDVDGLSRISADSSQETNPSPGVLGLNFTAGDGAPIVFRNSTVSGGSQSDVGYISMVEGKPQKPLSSSQKDLATSVKADKNGSAGDIRSHRRSASASSQPTQLHGVAGKNKLQTAQSVSSSTTAAGPVLDFSESDQFRSRVGSIVKKSANIALGNGSCNSAALPNQNVDSSAGLLMSSLGGEAILSPSQATELKVALNMPSSSPASMPQLTQQTKGATLPRNYPHDNPASESSQVKTNPVQNHSASAASLFRSASLKLSNALISPLEGNATAIAAKTVISNRLQWVRSSIRKKLDMNQLPNGSQCQKQELEKSFNGGETLCHEMLNGSQNLPEKSLDELDANSNDLGQKVDTVAKPPSPLAVPKVNGTAISPNRTLVTHGDPLGALGANSGTVATGTVDSKKSETAPVKSPARSFVIPDSDVRLFVGASTASQEDSDHNGDESSSDDDDDDSETDSDESTDDDDDDEDDDDDHSNGGMASKLSFSRYSGARWSLRKPDFRVNLGTQVLENALNSLSPQNLNARKAELMVGLSKLQNAASSVAKKLDGFKGVIGGGSTTPAKSGSGLLYSSSETDRTLLAPGTSGPVNTLTVEDGSQESWSSWTAQWLRRASSADLTSQSGQSTSNAEWTSADGHVPSVLKGAPSLTSLSGHLDRLCPSKKGPNGQGRGPIAMEIIMTSSSKCHNCQSILYDEEIMAGWTPEDSNLNTKCQHCKKFLVPFLTIHVKDYRCHALSTIQEYSPHDVMTPGVSQESVLSLPIPTNRKSSYNSAKSVDSDSKDAPSEAVDGESDDKSASGKSVKKSPAPLITPVVSGPITVPYLSPLVLRRELENILEQEGDVCLTKASFVDQHSIHYWNMVWFFERVGLVSHLVALALRANIGLNTSNNNENQSGDEDGPKIEIHPSWSAADERNVSVKTKWDNPLLYDEIGPPLYTLWQQTDEQHSPLVNALVTDHQPVPRSVKFKFRSDSFMQQLIAGIQYNDMLRPLKLMSSELSKRRTKSGSVPRHHGIYRELLFLSFAAIGRENIDQVAFDREYRLAYDRLDSQYNSVLAKVDAPPTIASVFCRHYFRELEL